MKLSVSTTDTVCDRPENGPTFRILLPEIETAPSGTTSDGVTRVPLNTNGSDCWAKHCAPRNERNRRVTSKCLDANCESRRNRRSPDQPFASIRFAAWREDFSRRERRLWRGDLHRFPNIGIS